MATYSERIKELRNQIGWSQLQLADKLGLSKQTISQYDAHSASALLQIPEEAARPRDQSALLLPQPPALLRLLSPLTGDPRRLHYGPWWVGDAPRHEQGLPARHEGQDFHHGRQGRELVPICVPRRIRKCDVNSIIFDSI